MFIPDMFLSCQNLEMFHAKVELVAVNRMQ